MTNTIYLESRVRELRRLQALIKDMQQQADAIKDSLKVILGDNEMLEAGEYKLWWQTVESKRFDKDAMIDCFGKEQYDFFCRPVVTRRFCVT